MEGKRERESRGIWDPEEEKRFLNRTEERESARFEKRMGGIN
jgi:hypothetical protein